MDLRLLVNPEPRTKVVWARCPKHFDRGRQNLAVYADHVHCYRCGYHASAEQYLRDTHRSAEDLRRAASASPVKEAPPPRVYLSQVHEWASRLKREVRVMEWLRKRGLRIGTIGAARLGWDGRALVIPVLSRDGELLTVRYRRDPKDPAQPKYWGLRGSRTHVYAPWWWPDSTKVVLCEGELDAMLAMQELPQGYQALTLTNGIAAWLNPPEEVWPALKGRRVYVAFDQDVASVMKAVTVGAAMRRKGLEVYVMRWSILDGKDVTELVVRQGSQALLAAVANALPVGVRR